MSDYDVIVIGAGPSGLSAASALKKHGINKILVVEREAEAGGVPRHCGHPPFGLREFKRLLTGISYAKKLVHQAESAGIEIRTSVNVVEMRPNAELLVTTNNGAEILKAKRAIYATGAREEPRSSRLISGNRPNGVINTGALQASVYLKKCLPFKRPVIIGSELVSFSAIQTCHHAGIKPVAIIEADSHPTARWPVPYFALLKGIPLYTNIRAPYIHGDPHVEAIEFKDKSNALKTIECDGVVLSGRFTPESSLARTGHLRLDPGSNGPVIDQFGRCSDPAYFATGNVLRPIETAGWCWNEGRQTGTWVANDLLGKLPPAVSFQTINITSDIIKYAAPQRIALPDSTLGMANIQIRFSRRAQGTLQLHIDGKTCWEKSLHAVPERRILIPLSKISTEHAPLSIELGFEQK